MPLFLEHLLEESNRWGIQVIQQALSLLSNVPLRLLDWEKTLHNEPEVHNGPFLHQMDESSADAYLNRNKSGWVTAPVRIHPLVDCLRRDKYWLACERRFFRRSFANPRSNNSVLGPISYFSDRMNVAAVRIEFPAVFNGFLVAGPVFTRPLQDGEFGSFTDIVNEFVGKIIEQYAELRLDHEFEKNDLRLRARATGWIYDKCLVEDAALLGDILTDIFMLEHDPKKIPHIKNVSYYLLAQYVYLLHQDLAPSSPSLPILAPGDKLLFLLDKHEHVVLESTFTKSGWRIALVTDPGLSERRIVLKGSLEARPEQVVEAEAQILKRIGEMGQSLAYRFHGYAGQKVKRLLRRLHNEFGVISAELESGVFKAPCEKKVSIEKSYQELTRRIEGLFNCDLVTVYIYDHAAKTLVPRSAHIQRSDLSDEQRRAYLDEERITMADAATNERERRRSISYRAVDSGLPRFCRAFDPGNGQTERADPPEELLLDPYMARIDGRCAIAVPMNVNGVIFGVLEVVGSQPYQFRPDFVQLAQEIADILGPFLYQREMLSALATINQVALDEQIPDQDRYHEICKQAASIFLADACALWIPPVGRQTVFELRGWYDSPDTKPYCNTNMTPYVLSEDQNDSMVIQASEKRRKDNVYFSLNDMAEWVRKHQEWIDRNPRRRSIADKYQYAGVVAVVDPKTTRNLCALSLYYEPHPQCLSRPNPERWQYTAQFMAHYVAISIAAINTRKEVEEQLLRFLSHEFNHLVIFVESAVSQVIALRAAGSPDSEVQRKKDELDHYIRLTREFSRFIRGESFLQLISSGQNLYEYMFTHDRGIKLLTKAEEVDLAEYLATQTSGFFAESGGDRIMMNCSEMGEIRIRLRKDPFWICYWNLITNALEYSLPGSLVSVRGNVESDRVVICVSNVAKCLKDRREEETVFAPGMRGSNVEISRHTGQGLDIARNLSQIQGIELDYHIERTHDGNCSFTFFMAIPFEGFKI